MITRTVLLALVLLLTMAPAATAQTTAFRADLKELNDSGVTGTADLTLRGTELELSITARGTPPRAQPPTCRTPSTCTASSAR